MLTVKDLQQYTTELSKKITFNTENLYQHNFMIRFNDGNRKASGIIINNDSISYTSTTNRFVEYMKNTFSSDNSNATGNLKNLLMVDGYYRNASNVWYIPKFLYYSTDAGTIRVLGLRNLDTVNPNALEILADFGTTFTVSDNVTTIALNNVNKPSIYETTTAVAYNGTNIGTCYWTLLKYPVSATKFKYEWIGHANCTSVSIPVTTSQGTGGMFRSGSYTAVTRPSMMTDKQFKDLSSSHYAPSSAFFSYQGGHALNMYYMKPASGTINGDLNINLYGSTIDV